MFECLKEKWKSSIVSRKDIEKLTGGIITSSTMAKLDCEGKGLKTTNCLQKTRVYYNIDDLINWFENKYEQI